MQYLNSKVRRHDKSKVLLNDSLKIGLDNIYKLLISLVFLSCEGVSGGEVSNQNEA
jgi:hypothetical protein